MTPTIDQLLTPTGGQTYSIQDVLSAIGNQYNSRPQYSGSMTIDDVLSKLGGTTVSVAPYEYGAKRFVSDVSPSSEYFKPAEFDAQKYKMDYENAADKAQRIYNETYADQIAAGKSEREAQMEAAKEYQRAQQVGSMAGAYIGNAIGGPVGGMIGAQLGAAAAPIIEPITTAVSDIGSDIGDIFGW